jgi:hypothetical protein
MMDSRVVGICSPNGATVSSPGREPWVCGATPLTMSSEPRRGDRSAWRDLGSVAPPGLGRGDRTVPSGFPGLTPWAIDGRPFGAAKTTTLESLVSLPRFPAEKTPGSGTERWLSSRPGTVEKPGGCDVTPGPRHASPCLVVSAQCAGPTLSSTFSPLSSDSISRNSFDSVLLRQTAHATAAIPSRPAR